MESKPEEQITRIEPSNAFSLREVRELWKNRYLVWLFFWRGFSSTYRQTMLGSTWHVVSPLISAGVYMFIFAVIARVPTGEIPAPLFFLLGVVTWNFFASAFTSVSHVFTEYAQIFSKVYFPRLTVPIAQLFSRSFTFAIQFGIFLAAYLLYLAFGRELHPNTSLLLAPLLILNAMLLAFGLGILVAALTVRFRDLSHLAGFVFQLWMFATPVFYPLTFVPEKWRWLMIVNPMTPVVQYLRYAFFTPDTFVFVPIWPSVVTTLVILVVGLFVFRRVERTFVDTI